MKDEQRLAENSTEFAENNRPFNLSYEVAGKLGSYLAYHWRKKSSQGDIYTVRLAPVVQGSVYVAPKLSKSQNTKEQKHRFGQWTGDFGWIWTWYILVRMGHGIYRVRGEGRNLFDQDLSGT